MYPSHIALRSCYYHAIIMRTQFGKENCFPSILWEYMVEAGTNLCDKQNHLKPFPGDQNAPLAWDLLILPPCSKPHRESACLLIFNSLTFLPNLDKSSSLCFSVLGTSGLGSVSCLQHPSLLDPPAAPISSFPS